MLLRVAMLALAATLLLPTASATICRDWYQVEAGPGRGVIDLGVAYSGQNAAGARDEIDHEAGDGDGRVSSGEVASYAAQWGRVDVPLTDECRQAFHILRLDGELPARLVRFEKETLEGTGDAQSTEPLWFRLVLTLEYPVLDPEGANVSALVADHAAFDAAFRCAIPSLRGWDLGPDCGANAQDAVAQPQHWTLAAGRGFSIAPDSVRPSEAARTWNGQDLEATSADERALMAQGAVEFRVDADSGFRVLDAALLAAAGGSAAAVGLGFLVWWTELRYGFLRILFALPGFSRLDRDRAAEHPRRQGVLEAVQAEPGISFNELGRRTEIPKGALAHHLRVLERLGFIRSQRERVWTRFYAAGYRQRLPMATSRQSDILEILRREPGLGQKDLAQRLGLERKAAVYHLHRLEKAELVSVQRRGVRRAYFVKTP